MVWWVEGQGAELSEPLQQKEEVIRDGWSCYGVRLASNSDWWPQLDNKTLQNDCRLPKYRWLTGTKYCEHTGAGMQAHTHRIIRHRSCWLVRHVKLEITDWSVALTQRCLPLRGGPSAAATTSHTEFSSVKVMRRIPWCNAAVTVSTYGCYCIHCVKTFLSCLLQLQPFNPMTCPLSHTHTHTQDRCPIRHSPRSICALVASSCCSVPISPMTISM